MPARAERVYICPSQDGQPARVIPFPTWWDRAAFMDRFRDRRTDRGNPIDANDIYVLGGGEAYLWDRQCRERALAERGNTDSGTLAEMRRLEATFLDASWVIVESYEWESGFD